MCTWGAVGDIYPESVQLKKGDYVIRVMLRHDDVQLLDKLKVRPPHFHPTPDNAPTIIQFTRAESK